MNIFTLWSIETLTVHYWVIVEGKGWYTAPSTSPIIHDEFGWQHIRIGATMLGPLYLSQPDVLAYCTVSMCTAQHTSNLELFSYNYTVQIWWSWSMLCINRSFIFSAYLHCSLTSNCLSPTSLRYNSYAYVICVCSPYPAISMPIYIAECRGIRRHSNLVGGQRLFLWKNLKKGEGHGPWLACLWQNAWDSFV